MSVSNPKGPTIDSGLCRCCGLTKKCRLLNAEYQWLGRKEVYSDMFVDTFGLLLSNLDGATSERLICATCVLRLRDATAFRRQVLDCEERLMQSWMVGQGDDDRTIGEIKVELEQESESIVPLEDNGIADDSSLQLDEDSDNIPLNQVVIKNEEKKILKKKKKLKTKKYKHLKSKQQMVEDRDQLIRQIGAMDRRREMRQKTDFQKRALENTVAIVENSYVCPFDTSFSDYFCIYCRNVFTDPVKLREHTLTHDPTTFKEAITNSFSKKTPQIDIMKIDCRLCTENFHDIENLKTHLSNAHGKTMHSLQNEFLKFRLTANNLSCIECGAVFSFFHALKKHMADHFGTCTCDVCGAHYFDDRMLALHKKSHQRTDESFPCKDCGKIFRSKHSRAMHETKIHKKEPSYQCPKCDLVFFSYNLRYRHLIESHGEERMFKCDFCERAYDSRKSLREHNRRVHLKVFQHQCDLCDKRFYLPSRLKEHMATHTGERNFRCEYCGKSYPRLRGLKVHMNSHNRDKKFKCTICHASFTQNVNLKNHARRQHQNLDDGGLENHTNHD